MMQLKNFNPNIVTITEIRRDIDKLNKILSREEEALVIKNQDIYFVALTPQKYKELKEKNDKKEKAIFKINEIREKYGEKNKNIGEFVSQMREKGIEKWKK